MNLVMIISGKYEGKPAELIKQNENTSLLKIFNTEEIIELNNNEIKKRKQCSCQRSKRYPFCDGSHSGS